VSSEHFVSTTAIRGAVKGRETEVLEALGIAWTGNHGHIDCPYGDHGGKDDWRWDQAKAVAFCTCIGSRPGEKKAHSIFDVASTMEGIDFGAAKIRVAEILGCTDLIFEKGGGQEHLCAEALLNPPADKRDNGLPLAYLANRLGVATAEVPLPRTRMAGWAALPYWDPPTTPRATRSLVGTFPCAVFEMADCDGRRHAHRIYVAPGGRRKSESGRAHRREGP
jgi:hypothetical protein